MSETEPTAQQRIEQELKHLYQQAKDGKLIAFFSVDMQMKTNTGVLTTTVTMIPNESNGAPQEMCKKFQHHLEGIAEVLRSVNPPSQIPPPK